MTLSPRIIISLIGGVLGIGAYFLTRGSYSESTWPRVYALSTFIGVYVFGNILLGVVQGMREAEGATTPDPKPPNPAPPRDP
jgi:hypothetical protein